VAITTTRSRDIAVRLAGWFFAVVGLLLVVTALLLWRWFPVVAWCFGLLGVAALLFGMLAPRQLRVSALDALVSFVLALG
jgi:fatty acid desaturase